MVNDQNSLGYIKIKDHLVDALISNILEEKDMFLSTDVYQEFNEVLNQYRKNRAYFLMAKYKGTVTLEEREWIEEEGYKEIGVDEQALYQFLLEWVDKNLGNYVNYADIEKWIKSRGYEGSNEAERIIRKMYEAVNIKKIKNNCLTTKHIDGYDMLEQWYGKENIHRVMDGLAVAKLYIEDHIYYVPNLLDAVLGLEPFSKYHTYKNTSTGGKITHPKDLKSIDMKDEKIEYKTLIYAPKKESQSRRLYIVYKEIKDKNKKLKKREVLEFIWARHGGNEEISRIYGGIKVVIHEKSTNKTNGYKEVANCPFY